MRCILPEESLEGDGNGEGELGLIVVLFSALAYYLSVEAGRGSVEGYAADFHIGAEEYVGEDHKVGILQSIWEEILAQEEEVRFEGRTDEKQLHGSPGDALTYVDYRRSDGEIYKRAQVLSKWMAYQTTRVCQNSFLGALLSLLTEGLGLKSRSTRSWARPTLATGNTQITRKATISPNKPHIIHPSPHTSSWRRSTISESMAH